MFQHRPPPPQLGQRHRASRGCFSSVTGLPSPSLFPEFCPCVTFLVAVETFDVVPALVVTVVLFFI